MIHPEKICLINYMLRIKKVTAWNVYLFRYLIEFLQDSELNNEKELLLDLTYKLVTNKVILQYVRSSLIGFSEEKYIEIINQLINIYLMSIEDKKIERKIDKMKKL